MKARKSAYAYPIANGSYCVQLIETEPKVVHVIQEKQETNTTLRRNLNLCQRINNTKSSNMIRVNNTKSSSMLRINNTTKPAQQLQLKLKPAGIGSYGRVYFAILDNEKHVSVKKLDASEDGSNDIQIEA